MPEKDHELKLSPVHALIVAGAIVIGSIFIATAILVTGDDDDDDKNTASADAAVAGETIQADDTPTPSSNSEITAKMAEVAADLGADKDEFTSCVENADFQDKIESHMTQAAQIGVNGTPGFLIGTRDGDTVTGETVAGAQPFSTFQATIQKYLDGEGTGTSSINVAGMIDEGPDTAEVVVVEITDLECPFCTRHHEQTYPSIKSTFVDNGKIGYVMAHFPLSFHDPVATVEALGVECVADQLGDTAGFEMFDYIFTNSGGNGLGL